MGSLKLLLDIINRVSGLGELVRQDKVMHKLNNTAQTVSRTYRSFEGTTKRLTTVTAKFNKKGEPVRAVSQKIVDISDEMARSQTDLARQMNIGRDAFHKQKEVMSKSGAQLVNNSQQLNQVTGQFDSLGKSLFMPAAIWKRVNKEGGKFNTIGGKIGNQVRHLTHGMRGFNMELLSLMFFGMAGVRFFTGLLKPAMENVGVFALFSELLGVLFLPLALKVLGWVINLWEWYGKLGDTTKNLINIFAALGVGLFGALMLYGMIGLGIGGLITSTQKWITAIVALKNMMGLASVSTLAFIGGIVLAFAGIILTIYSVSKVIEYWGESTRKVIGWIITSLGTLAIAIGGVMLIVGAAAAPWVLLGAAVALVVGQIIAHWDGFKAFWVNLWNSAKSVITSFFGDISNAWKNFWTALFLATPIGMITVPLLALAQYFKFHSDAPVGPLKPTTWGRDFGRSFAEGVGDTVSIFETTLTGFAPAGGTAADVIKAIDDAGKPLNRTVSESIYSFETMEDALRVYETLSDRANISTSTNVATWKKANEELNLFKEIIGIDMVMALENLRMKLDNASQGYDKVGKAAQKSASFMSQAAAVAAGGTALASGGAVFPKDQFSHADIVAIATGGGVKAQHGGIFTKPTLATIGEAGPEAVVPLEAGGIAMGGINITNYITASSMLDIDELKRKISSELSEELERTLARTR